MRYKNQIKPFNPWRKDGKVRKAPYVGLMVLCDYAFPKLANRYRQLMRERDEAFDCIMKVYPRPQVWNAPDPLREKRDKAFKAANRALAVTFNRMCKRAIRCKG